MKAKNHLVFNKLGGFFIELISLSTPRGRVSFYFGATLILLAIPYQYLEKTHLSVYMWLKLPSPSIGLTRAYWMLIHGNTIGAWHRNPLIYIVVIVVAFLIGKDCRQLYCNSKVKSAYASLAR